MNDGAESVADAGARVRHKNRFRLTKLTFVAERPERQLAYTRCSNFAALPEVKSAMPAVEQSSTQEQTALRSLVEWRDPERLSGVPCFAGTRVPIQSLFDYLEVGDSIYDFMDAFPA
jgi:uncharacterized protein (DUF433 family)